MKQTCATPPAAGRIFTAAAAILAAALALMAAGCEDDSFSHKPPAGLGSLIVDNHTGDRLEVFINGIESNRVSAYDYEAYDLNPGVHRVVIQERHGSRSYRDDVDILEGKLTVMRVRWFDSYSYTVDIYFD